MILRYLHNNLDLRQILMYGAGTRVHRIASLSLHGKICINKNSKTITESRVEALNRRGTKEM